MIHRSRFVPAGIEECRGPRLIVPPQLRRQQCKQAVAGGRKALALGENLANFQMDDGLVSGRGWSAINAVRETYFAVLLRRRFVLC